MEVATALFFHMFNGLSGKKNVGRGLASMLNFLLQILTCVRFSGRSSCDILINFLFMPTLK